MNLRLLAVLIAMSFSWSSAHAGYWRDSNGNPYPDTESRRIIGGFGGSLLITSDSDWEKKWNTPAETTPIFTEAKVVTLGERIFTLTFFANPKLNANHEANITCDLKVTRPNGTESINQRDSVCFQGRLNGEPSNMYLAAPVIDFIGEPGDPTGIWTVEITLKDNLRKVVMPLKATFTLK
ncbi:hypothetical protein [Pseudomonas frederiksbergensis]|jgi:hypothetical protein|uniref:Uncharacterized protein n=1 Tax=Pseudomonas frederiksbergensis TaxID=104087 RepID=A0A423HRR7_9PSED|nr:hypothetical protein [Pseudomonas frederiksbergensis]RON15866.1 hypothetical protein BK662_12405 [Pseudomonas frederiksbergensis]